MIKNPKLLRLNALLVFLTLTAGCHTRAKSVRKVTSKPFVNWISLLSAETLEGWTPTGAASWSIHNGILAGEGGRGHIYAAPVVADFEIMGKFRITNKGHGANSGLYFRSNPPMEDPNGFPRGYEAQVCNNQEAFTGWLWKPGKPTGKASALLTKDGEWFSMRVLATGPDIKIYVNDSLVTSHADSEYQRGRFAIQCHNAGMLTEVRELYYRELQ